MSEQKTIQWVTCENNRCTNFGVVKIMFDNGNTHAVCDSCYHEICDNEEKYNRTVTVLEEDEFGASKILEV
jgi:hypothetical protein